MLYLLISKRFHLREHAVVRHQQLHSNVSGQGFYEVLGKYICILPDPGADHADPGTDPGKYAEQ